MIHIAGNPVFPAFHGFLTWIVLRIQTFRCEFTIHNLLDHVSTVMLMWCYFFRQYAGIAKGTAFVFTPADRYTPALRFTPDVLYIPVCMELIDQFLSAPWADRIFIDDD